MRTCLAMSACQAVWAACSALAFAAVSCRVHGGRGVVHHDLLDAGYLHEQPVGCPRLKTTHGLTLTEGARA